MSQLKTISNYDSAFVGHTIVSVNVEACNYIVFELEDRDGYRKEVAITAEVVGQLPMIYKDDNPEGRNPYDFVRGDKQ
ncbi:MAG: hypothetical protein ACWGQW_20430 [bacterium]